MYKGHVVKVVDLNPADEIAYILALLCCNLERDLEPDVLANATQLSVSISTNELKLVHELVTFAVKLLEPAQGTLFAHRQLYEQEAEVLGEQLRNHPNASLTTTFSFLCAYMHRAVESPKQDTSASFQP